MKYLNLIMALFLTSCSFSLLKNDLNDYTKTKPLHNIESPIGLKIKKSNIYKIQSNKKGKVSLLSTPSFLFTNNSPTNDNIQSK